MRRTSSICVTRYSGNAAAASIGSTGSLATQADHVGGYGCQSAATGPATVLSWSTARCSTTGRSRIFDKPHRLTISGVHRGVQRALYYTRRDKEVPVQGLRLIVIRPGDLISNRYGRLRRDPEPDSELIRVWLAA
jgi:hypothetical protein